MGTKLLLGFGGTVIQVVVHLPRRVVFIGTSFGGTVIQVVVHPGYSSVRATFCFGGTVNQVTSPLVSEVR